MAASWAPAKCPRGLTLRCVTNWVVCCGPGLRSDRFFTSKARYESQQAGRGNRVRSLCDKSRVLALGLRAEIPRTRSDEEILSLRHSFDFLFQDQGSGGTSAPQFSMGYVRKYQSRRVPDSRCQPGCVPTTPSMWRSATYRLKNHEEGKRGQSIGHSMSVVTTLISRTSGAKG